MPTKAPSRRTTTSPASSRTDDGQTGRASTSRTRGRRVSGAGRAAATKGPAVVLRARLFDADGEDRDVEVTRDLIRDLDERQTLWLDLTDPDDPTVEAVADLWDLAPETVRAAGLTGGPPHLAAFDRYLHLSVTTIETDADGDRTAELACVVDEHTVITIHREPLAFLDRFQDHLRGDTAIGLIDGPAFVALLLDWLLTGYFRAVETLEQEADRLDHRALHPRSERDLLADLVRLRRRISTLRRALTPHREVVAALTRPQLTGLGDPDDEAVFRALAERLERAIDAVETARELVIGSFDVYMTRTAQRTNDIMKVLTLVTVILLPSSVIAGVMGMNFKVALFEDAGFFWIVLVGMIAIAAGTLAFARMRRWI
jgi:magnesium transporter